MALLYFRVCLSLYVFPKWAVHEIEAPEDYWPFEGEHLEWARTSQLAPIWPYMA